jgi:hypothetical protein
MSDFGNKDAHLQALETLQREHGTQALGPHKGGYLTQDEYATLIYYWAGEEHSSEAIDGVIATLANASWARVPSRGLPVAGTVLALCELYPDKAGYWRGAYSELFVRVGFYMTELLDDPGWNDFYIAQWFVLRRARKEEGIEIIDKLLDRVAQGGCVRYDTLEAMKICATQCKPFEIAWQCATQKRNEAMFRI